MPRKVLPAALMTGPFRLSDLRRWGLPDQLVRTRQFRRLFHGVYAASCLPDTLRLRVEAAALILPASAVFSHHTAAGLRDLPVPSTSHLHVTVPPGTAAPRGNGILAHRASVEGAVTTSRGVRTTTPVRTFLDLSRSIGLIDAVVLGDAMVRRTLASVGELQDAANRASGRGSSAIRAAAPLVRGRVDSPMETRVRLLLALAGLPEPEPGVEVLDDHRWVATVDLAYAAQRIAIEYDGDLHRVSKRKWRHDVAARELLRDLGWNVILVTADDIYVRPHYTLERVHAALVTRDHPDVPPALDDRWRSYFRPRGHLTDHW